MSIELTINGKHLRVNLSGLPADITLNTYIRENVGLSGTKFMCLEGGCGVCICVVQKKHPVTEKETTWAVNSCLTLLNVCDGWCITTIEGIGNKLKGYHPIQKQLANLNGSQCGYCSPGMVMNMYGLLRSKNGQVTMKEVENSFGGNICRCTGYRPIMDTMKSFAIDADQPIECCDIEDLALACPKTGRMCEGTCGKPPFTYESGKKWFWPNTLNELYQVVNEFADEEYILVAGNTAHGVYRRSPDIKNFVNINGIPELHLNIIDGEFLILGANLSLSETMDVFREAAKVPGFEYCQELHNHFDLIANVPVRNMGTLAGNLMIKHDHPEFPSDIFITFEALKADVIIANGSGSQTISLKQFLKTDIKGMVIIAFRLQAYSKERYVFKSFKVMPRAQNAKAYVNAAFLLEISPTDGRVGSAQICFGGISPNFVHATSTEILTLGRNIFSKDVLEQLLESLNIEINPSFVVAGASLEYRRMLALGLFYKFILSAAPVEIVEAKWKSGGTQLERALSSGRQVFTTSIKNSPVNQPVKKLEAMIQCSGEAKYANDLPTQPNEVWCAFVNATKISAQIVDIDATEALKIQGVIAFYSAKDIPGKNSFVDPNFFLIDEDEEIFCSHVVRYHNQPLGVIVAETNDLASLAASKVTITYSEGDSKIFPNIKSVLEANQLERIEDGIVSPIEKLEIPSEAEISGSGAMEFNRQYHFTMEPQTTIVLPIDGKLEVYSSTQWMDLTQFAIAKCLQKNVNDVQLKVRRVGGAFGAKISRSVQVACAAALAAEKPNRPARFVQTIESMMGSLGKRFACSAEYEFHANTEGSILALQAMFYEDTGCVSNENVAMFILKSAFKNCYNFGDNQKLDAKTIFTDTPGHTLFRSPGYLEGFGTVENVLEHVAFELGLDPVDVRMRNIASDNKIRELIEGFVESTEYTQRRREIELFNSLNRWQKRGLGLSVMQYSMEFYGPFPATVAIYHGDGSVIVSHGGVELGQGINTKVAQVAAYTLGVPLEMVKIDVPNTVNGANSYPSTGSVSSECICLAVRKSCDTLNDRLRPIRESMSDPSWLSLITQAYKEQVNLIAEDQSILGEMPAYTVYGMSLTEVEVDFLTGNHLIKRVDILEDTGESLNPAVDIGQIEGAFVMGLGHYLTEHTIDDPKTGAVLTNRTWNYKPPGCKDIPIDFRIELIQTIPNLTGFMRSKATGEPATCLSVSAIFAIQHALQSARKDAGVERKWISFGAPTTPEHILLNSGTDVSQFLLKQES